MSNQKKSFSVRRLPPFRGDIVGSFLRPKALKEARAKYKTGKIGARDLRAVEDGEIRKLVEKEKAVGLKSVTDGEFRRSWWHLDFMWGLDGVEKKLSRHGYPFHGLETRPETVRLSGKIRFGEHPFLRDFKFLKEAAGDSVVARQTIPAPAQLWAELFRDGNAEETRAVYPDAEKLRDDIVRAYRDAVQAFYKAGCRNLQLDDCTWGMLCDRGYREFLKSSGGDPGADARLFAELDSRVAADHPADMAVNLHVCRGNYHSAWAASGGYEAVAQTLFGGVGVDAFYLEYDSDRAGGFEPLRFIKNQLVVLGLVTSKSPALEDPALLRRRIAEAAEYVPLDRLCLSTQCGFASTEEGNVLTEEEQWDKVRLVLRTARSVWAD